MSGQIQTELPIWLASIGLVLAFFLSWYSYTGSRNRESFSKFQRIFLASLRGIGIFILCVLILGLFFKSVDKIESKPNFIIAVDQSQSMLLGSDSATLGSELAEFLESVENKIGKRFNIHTYGFGNGLHDSLNLLFPDPLTNYSSSFAEVFSSYSHQAVAELLIISDGIETGGASLESVLRNWPHPVSIIACGDSTSRTDARIETVTANDIAYLNAFFPVEILVECEDLDQDRLGISIQKGEEHVIDTTVIIDPIDGKGRMHLMLSAAKTGQEVYTVNLQTVPAESNIINNQKSFAVEIVEKKSRVLLLYQQPHPDLSVLTEIIENTGDYEIVQWPLSMGKPDIEDFSLVILYQLPIGTDEDSFIDELIQKEINLFFVVGPESSLARLNTLSLGVEFNSKGDVFEDFEPHVNGQFELFTLPDGFAEYLNVLPPLKGHLSSVELNSAASILLRQSIKGIALNEPLLWFSRLGSKRIGFWWGEGLWRWNTFEFLNFNDHYFTNTLIRSVLSYLSVGDLNDPLKVDVPRVISSLESLSWSARLYNESFELINNIPLYLDIFGPDGESRKIQMRSLNDSYWLTTDKHFPGKYTYKAYATLNGVEVSKSGSFEVLEIPYEELDQRARFTELDGIAKQKGGEMYTFPDRDEAIARIVSMDTEIGAVYQNSSWKNILDWYFLLFIIVGIFAMEWILRRFLGTR